MILREPQARATRKDRAAGTSDAVTKPLGRAVRRSGRLRRQPVPGGLCKGQTNERRRGVSPRLEEKAIGTAKRRQGIPWAAGGLDRGGLCARPLGCARDT